MIRKSHVLTAVAFALMLPVAALAQDATAAKSDAAPKAKAHTAAHTKKAPATDINSASKEDLMKLSGMTDENAEKIIAGRPYKSKAELVSKKILTKAEYAKIRSHVVAKQEKPAEMKSETKPSTESNTATTTPETGK